MKKSSSLLLKATQLEKSLVDIELNMIATLLKAGISRELADATVKKIIQTSDYNIQLQKIKDELNSIGSNDDCE